MQNVSCLHFPETIAQYWGFRQLLLFFDNITQLLPSEDSLQSENPFISKGLVKQYAPLPFGEDLIKFNRLIQDMQRHSPDFYGSSFSSLSSSAALQVDEDSVLSLISQMKPEDETVQKSQAAEALLQARIFLKLRGIHEIEERELRENIQSINEKKADLLSALKGDVEEAKSLMNNLNMGTDQISSDTESPLRLKQRLKAWSALHLADTREIEAPWLITTGSADAFELLTDALDPMKQPEHLVTIPLADAALMQHDENRYFSFLEDFQKKTKNCRQRIFQTLRKAAETGFWENDINEAEAIDLWKKAIESLSRRDTRSLEFHLVKMPFAEFLIEGLSLKNAASQSTPLSNTILAVLK